MDFPSNRRKDGAQVNTFVLPLDQDKGNLEWILYSGGDELLSVGLLASGAVVFYLLLKLVTELFTGFHGSRRPAA